MVVIVHPFGGAQANLIEGTEDVCAEHITAQGSVEPFDVSVLRGLARLDEGEGDLLELAPVIEFGADELRSIVHADHGR